MPNPPRPRSSHPRRLIIYSIILLVAFTFAISSHDEAAFRSFSEAVGRWQVNPEFRAIAMDYSIRGSAAMRTGLFGIPAKRVIIAARSVPFLPKSIAVNPTSRLHYQNFTRGPLSAYLHLCSEQDVPDIIGVVESAGRIKDPTDADLRKLLDGFKMDFPVTTDRGALRSVAGLLRDADAGRPFTIRVDIGPLLAEPIRHIAAELNVPGDPEAMTPDQQQEVLDRLDSDLRFRDFNLWRTKQVNDFCGGVWAQVFSPPYNGLIVPVLAIHVLSRFALIALLGFLAIWRVRRAGGGVPAAVAGDG